MLLQTIGIILSVSSCCICSMSGAWDPLPSHGTVHKQIESDTVEVVNFQTLIEYPGRAGTLLTASIATVGGLALAVFGLGLQSDKPRAAMGSVLVCAAMILVLLIGAVALWMGTAPFLIYVWNHGLVLLTMGLMLFCLAALRQILADPPSGELEILPDDFEIPKSIH